MFYIMFQSVQLLLEKQDFILEVQYLPSNHNDNENGWIQQIFKCKIFLTPCGESLDYWHSDSPKDNFIFGAKLFAYLLSCI